MIGFAALNDAPLVGRVRAEVREKSCRFERYILVPVGEINDAQLIMKEPVVGPW